MYVYCTLGFFLQGQGQRRGGAGARAVGARPQRSVSEWLGGAVYLLCYSTVCYTILPHFTMPRVLLLLFDNLLLSVILSNRTTTIVLIVLPVVMCVVSAD